MLTVLTWLWTPRPGYRSAFGPAHVNALRHMVARHYRAPHRFVCATDQVDGFDAGVELLPGCNDFADVPSPHGARHPSCYRRLRLFAPDVASTLGPRIVSLDLDCVVTGDLAPLWDRPDPFVGWRDAEHRTLNASMMLLTAGARPGVFTEFDPARSPSLARRAGFLGSDQAWISYRAGHQAAYWDTADGVYSFRLQIDRTKPLPANARIVFFHGKPDPWDAEAQRLAWVRAHYPMAEVAA